MKEVVILAGAEADWMSHYRRLDEAAPGMGDMFDTEIVSQLTALAHHPGLGSKQKSGHRRLLVSRWHVGIYYHEYPSRIAVAALLDLRQDPKSIQRRLEEA